MECAVIDLEEEPSPSAPVPIEIPDDESDVEEIMFIEAPPPKKRRRANQSAPAPAPPPPAPFDEQLARSLQAEDDERLSAAVVARHLEEQSAVHHDSNASLFAQHAGSWGLPVQLSHLMQHSLPHLSSLVAAPLHSWGGQGFGSGEEQHAVRGSTAQRVQQQMSRNGDFTEADYELLSQLDDARPTKKGASQAQINQLTTTTVQKGAKIESCCICMSDMEHRQKVRVLPCDHTFHAGCIGRWLKLNKSCPVCKAVAT